MMLADRQGLMLLCSGCAAFTITFPSVSPFQPLVVLLVVIVGVRSRG